MADILSAEEKAAIQAELQNVRDTFARDIYVYVKTKQTASWGNNPFYGNSNPTSSLSSEEELTKFTYEATVLYENNQNQELFDGSAQANLPSSEGTVRIKVSTSEANEKIKICERIEIDGDLFVVDSDPKPIGPFSPQAFMWFLKREN
jgi:hypothetical protein